ncbi:MAG: phosphomannomutase/phosphoglucomutase [Clostridium sp.]|nr:phosphomannomutase/phosphoglucomutase [Clostridium sp.]
MEAWKEAYLKLQNGSDVRGVALESAAGEAVNLTENIVRDIAMAFAEYLMEKKEDKVMRVGVGHDSRLSAQELKRGVINGLGRRGCRVYDCGLTSTPSMFMSTVLEGFEYDGAVMITASHLPPNRNGLKFFTRDGGLESSDIKAVLERAALISRMNYETEYHRAEDADLTGAYTEYLRNLICKEVNADDYDRPLEGLHIVIDASNGVSGYFKNVLEPLGASTKGSICMNPDGTFPVHVPNPENEKAMDALKKAVLAANADLGVIFDTDGDRAAFVFADGEEVNKDGVIALMAAALSEKYPHTTVVTDSVTSDCLTEFLENRLKMKHHRFKRGYKNVINEAIRLNKEGIETHLAIETSGHGAVKENYFLDDGAYMSVVIISRLAVSLREGRRLEDLTAGLKKPAESREVRLRILAPDYKEYGRKILEDFRIFAEQEEKFHIAEPNYEGIRINFQDDEVKGWMLIRMSLHDPILPLNFEADREGGVAVIAERLRPFLERYTELRG